MKKRMYFISGMLLIMAINVFSKTIYVASDGNNTNDGLTWNSAVANLVTAYAKATAGDQIWIAGGTYYITETINMKDDVNVYGGFEKGGTSVAERTRPNAIDEPWKFTHETVFTVAVPVTFRPIDRVDKDATWKGAVIDGIVLKDIETTNARVAYFNNGVTFQNSIVTGCSSTLTHIYFERNSLIRHCLFENNYKQNVNGLTVQLRGSRENEESNILEDCLFRNNRCESLSIYNTGTAGSNPGKHTVRRTKFINNEDKVFLINERAIRPIDIYECLFEGNEAASAAASSPDGSIITGGSSGELTIARCIVRNNKNTSAGDANWKNSIISLNSSTAKLVNCLVVNNSSLHLTVYTAGSIYNSTIVNNEGSLFGTGWASLFNNAFIDNKPTNGVIPFKMDTESACYFVNNAFNSRSNIGTGGPNAEVVGTIETDITAFVNPTTFQGVAQTDAQKLELSNANFSLVQTATLKNAGTIVELKDFMGATYDTDLFQKDLAGNARLGSNNELNIGAYQGDALSGIYDLIDDTLLSVTVVRNGLILNVDSEVIASIYSTSGTLLFTKRLNQGENFIPVNAKGVSILQVGSKSTKIVM